jgi:membrane protein implicated in regulation of membrane protease activity
MRTALLLALFLGPVGLFYVSAPIAAVLTFVGAVVAVFTFGVGLVFVWLVSLLVAYAWAHGSQVAAREGIPEGAEHEPAFQARSEWREFRPGE